MRALEAIALPGAGEGGAVRVDAAHVRVVKARQEVVADAGAGAFHLAQRERAVMALEHDAPVARLGRARAALVDLPDAREAGAVHAAGGRDRDQVAEVHPHDRVGPGGRGDDQVAGAEAGAHVALDRGPVLGPGRAQRREQRDQRLDDRQRHDGARRQQGQLQARAADLDRRRRGTVRDRFHEPGRLAYAVRARPRARPGPTQGSGDVASRKPGGSGGRCFAQGRGPPGRGPGWAGLARGNARRERRGWGQTLRGRCPRRGPT